MNPQTRHESWDINPRARRRTGMENVGSVVKRFMDDLVKRACTAGNPPPFLWTDGYDLSHDTGSTPNEER